ncbi:hypothetical protein MOQ_005922 [Trypanosoma cruzi marinkellei]|uniref:Uncharacterized protein n=1 Tax=Trypanosoma cruzi marinkellei TaxID=85056 RepID=K2NN32_TRYCR|nr:hypothetical protein MOQ_005922 [Trypanosoma cruzi marinkellei]
MTEYITPGRRTHPTAARTNAGDGGSAGRRVLRSALELLAETASPEILRGQTSSSNTVAPAKFAVTYATAPALPLGVTAQQLQKEQQLQRSLPAGNNDMVTTEEPSTLLFLSPSSAAGGGDSAVKKRLFKKKKKTVRLSDSAKKTAKAVAKEMWGLETPAGLGTASDGEKEKQEIGGGSIAFGSSKNELYDKGRQLTKNEPLFTEEEVQERILEALKAYEARRDAEEESVLQEVGHEIESQNERYEKLLREKQASAEECDALKLKMEQLALHCEALQGTITELQHELQEALDRASRTEVELCHAQDEKRMKSAELQQELNFEKAQWKLAQEEMQRQITEFEAQLRSRTFEWHELQETTRVKENKQAWLSEQLEACRKELEDWRQRHSETQATAAELKELIEAKEVLIRQLQLKVQEVEKSAKRATTSSRDEQTQLESRLRSVEEALQQQTDEVRRKMHRVHVLETELARVEEVKKTQQRLIHEATNSFFAVHSTLETFVDMFRNGCSTRASTRGLRDTLFPASEWCEPHSDAVEDLCATENDALCYGQKDEDEEEGCVEGANGSFFELITCKELRDDLRQVRSRLGGNKVPTQQQRQNAQRLRSNVHPTASKKCANNNSDEVDESGRLQRCHRLCERLLETLRRLYLQQRKEMQHRVQHMEARQAEQSKSELKHCQDALAACQRSLEESKQQGQLLSEECNQRKSEVRRLEAALVELHAAEQEVRVQQKKSTDRMEELQRERGILRIQLDASQRDCVELRERYESVREEAEEARERARLLEKSQRSQEEAMEAKAKVLARLARCTEKLKKTEEECKSLRDENEVLSNKMKSMLLQLQTSRMEHRNKSTTASVRQQQQQQEQQQEELNKLKKEMGELRTLQESAATLHARESAEAKLSVKKLTAQNEELREELAKRQRALSDALNDVELQKRAEATTLRTLMSIHQAGSEGANETCADGNSPRGVQQRLFDASPIIQSEDGMNANREEISIFDLRGRVVSLAQRAALELARLREAIPSGTHMERSETLESFRAAERVAWEAAKRSAARRQPYIEENGESVPLAQPPLSRRTAPVLRSGVQKQQKQLQQQNRKNLQCHMLGTPCRHSPAQKSPSPKQAGRDVAPIGFFPGSHPVFAMNSDAMKRTAGNERSLPCRGASSSSLTSAGGVSRSRSARGVLDGSSSPVRPPMLRATSVR